MCLECEQSGVFSKYGVRFKDTGFKSTQILCRECYADKKWDREIWISQLIAGVLIMGIIVAGFLLSVL